MYLTAQFQVSCNTRIAEMELRTQGSGPRPRTQKNPRPRTALPRTKPLEAKNRNARRQGQEPRTPAQAFSTKNFFQAISKQKIFKKILLVLELSCRGFYVQAYADDLAVLVTDVDMLRIRDMAQKAINIAANWASEQELQFSSKKKQNCTVHSQTESRFGFLVNELFKT